MGILFAKIYQEMSDSTLFLVKMTEIDLMTMSPLMRTLTPTTSKDKIVSLWNV